MLALRLTTETESRLDHIAKVTGRSKHFYAVEAVETHLKDLESKYLSAQEQAQVQALVDFDRIEMAIAREIDPDVLSPAEYDHFFESDQDRLFKPSEEVDAFYASLGSSRITAAGETVWRHDDGTDKPYPPAA